MERNEALISRRYASALIRYYHWFDKDIKWINRCVLVADFLHKYRQRFLYVPHSFYKTFFDNAGLSDFDVAVVLQLLEQRQRVGLLSSILYEIADLYKQHHGIEMCVVKSAAPLTDDQKERLRQCLERVSSKKLYFEYALDTSLIAGIRVQGETFCFEDSVAKKLNTMDLLWN